MIVNNSAPAPIMLLGNTPFNTYTLGSVPCIPRPSTHIQQNNNLTQLDGYLGEELRHCRWVKMGEGWWEWVCFRGAEGGGSSMHGDSPDSLPYCDTITAMDEIIYWVKENPLPAAAIGAGAAWLLSKLF